MKNNSTRIPFALLAAFVVIGLVLTGCPSSSDVKPDDIAPKVSEPIKPAPKPAPVAEEIIKKSGIEAFEVDGLKVILKPTPGRPVVSAELLIEGGVTNTPPGEVGVEAFALLVAASGGTKAHPKDQFSAKLNSMGSAISYDADRDYSSLTLQALRPYWGATWDLFAEVINSPAFDEKQIVLNRTRIIEQIKSMKDDADGYVGILAGDLHFKGHPYGVRPIGKAEALEKVTREKVAAYYSALLTRERLTLVVVGDLTRADLEQAIKAKLGNLPKGNYTYPGLKPLSDQKAGVLFDERPELPTNYMIGLFNAPAPTHPDYFPMLVATNMLSDRLFEEVRTKRNLSYAVSAGLSGRRQNYGYFYVTTVKPNETVQVMYSEVERLSTQPLSAKEFSDLINVFLTEYYMRLETHSAQAGLLAAAEMNGGGWEQTLVFIDRVKAVTPEDIMRVTKTYFTNVHWGYIGKPAQVDKGLLESL